MALKTLNATDKAAFQKAGIRLTPSKEHLAVHAKEEIVKAGINWDWSKILQMAAEGVKIAFSILAIFGVSLPPAQSKKAVAAGCVDHCDCCCKCVHKTLDLLDCELHHLCCCMDEQGYCS